MFSPDKNLPTYPLQYKLARIFNARKRERNAFHVQQSGSSWLRFIFSSACIASILLLAIEEILRRPFSSSRTGPNTLTPLSYPGYINTHQERQHQGRYIFEKIRGTDYKGNEEGREILFLLKKIHDRYNRVYKKGFEEKSNYLQGNL